MIRKLLTVTVLTAALLCACGAPPEPIAETHAALNGYSAPPAGYSWQTFSQPWICAGAQSGHPAWIPTAGPWPMNQTNSWCRWMPDVNAGTTPWNVDWCWPGGTPSGAMDIYSGRGITGQCARIYGLSAPIYGLPRTTPFEWDADLIESNGWHSRWTPPGGTPQLVAIRSMIIGPQTDAYLCEGPFTGPAGARCNAYRSMGISTGGLQIAYQDMLGSNGSFFEAAAIRVNANQ